MEVRQISQTLNANERTHFPLSGRYVRLLGTVNPVTFEVGRNGEALGKVSSIEAGLAVRLRPDQQEFTDLWVTTTAAEAVSLLVSDGDVTYDRTFIQYAQARTLTLPGTATIGAAEGVVIAAGNRSKLFLLADPTNTDVIALGPTGLTVAGTPIVLGPGDMWVEEIAASAAWFGRSATAGQLVRIMTAS